MQKQSLFAAALVIGLAVLLPASAQVYKWTDEQGRTVISDKPRAGKGEQKPVVPGSSSYDAQNAAQGAQPPATAEQSLADKELAFRKRQQDKKDAAEKAEKEKQAAARKERACKSMQNNLRLLESGRRLAVVEDDGPAVHMDDTMRQKHIADHKARISEQCGS